jgi:hypothetical protein
MDAMKHFSTREAARILEIEESRVRSLARLGAIAASDDTGRLELTFQDLVVLRTTKGLAEAGVPARRLRRLWSSLRRQVDTEQPLSGITLTADGDRAIASDGVTRWHPDSGQYLLPFGGEEPRAAVEPAPIDAVESPPAARRAAETRRARPPDAHGVRRSKPLASIHPFPPPATRPASERTAEQWFQLAGELEASSPRECREAYEKALALDPDFGDAHLDLGRLLHQAGDHDQAGHHYDEAIRCSPRDPIAWFNLGVLEEDRGRTADAIRAYDRAISVDPDMADAHYNLGLLHESLGNRGRAMKHLMVARQLYAHGG